ncbi:ribosome biogenesis GTPase Der [Candidatus Liberibacter sp.]|uniref:ribosome biogenesis GTPase Der n=1 Tax=Candidatus Liberibacter sp. TaxID=34022 RepID=UPI0015F49285|nr:ribosome biogenesis GTPase Der [Candidatus Liberibacter sp.]MBA5724108.1 ribosome biogenesis GTPase Der [Candidatus Liberibacter sp.]
MGYTIAIVGSPNTGKSTLFNRLIKKKVAIVNNRAGTTRDRRYGTVTIGDSDFNIIDTAGIENRKHGSIVEQINNQTEMALREADLAFFVIDSKAGITPYDDLIARFLRKQNIPIVLVANKMETRIAQSNFYEIFSFGFKEIVEISAEHGRGISELHDIILKFLKNKNLTSQVKKIDCPEKIEKLTDDDKNPNTSPIVSSDLPKRSLRIAIVGRPNVGKSTLINRFLGYNRLLEGPETGITRDSISVKWNWKNHPIEMFDTAGMRKRARITEETEKLSVRSSLQSVRLCETAIIVLDATVPFEKQDLHIVDSVLGTGRAAVLAFNKWDEIKNRSELLQDLREKAIRNLPQVGNIRTVAISGSTGEGLDDLMLSVLETNNLWKTRISTGKLNSWLEKIQLKNPAPKISGRYRRLKYITQVRSSPPSFVIFCASTKDMPDSYTRYLMNRLRIDFSLPGIPIRINFRSSKNPYI